MFVGLVGKSRVRLSDQAERWYRVWRVFWLAVFVMIMLAL